MHNGKLRLAVKTKFAWLKCFCCDTCICLVHSAVVCTTYRLNAFNIALMCSKLSWLFVDALLSCCPPCCLKGVTQVLPAVTNKVDTTKGEDGENWWKLVGEGWERGSGQKRGDVYSSV